MRGFIGGIAFTVVATAIAGYFIIRGGVIPANADGRPPGFEVWAARTSLHATLAHAPKVANPLAQDAATQAAGLKVYEANCAVCHGDSRGRPTAIAAGLYQHAPQLGRYGVEDDPQYVTYWKVAHGIRWTGMPAFRKTLRPAQLWQVTSFLKTMDTLAPPVDRAWRAFRVPAQLAPPLKAAERSSGGKGAPSGINRGT